MTARVRASSGYTIEEARALEETSPFKLELVAGRILARAPTSPEHAALTALISHWLMGRLAGTPCRTYAESLAVGLASGEEYVHPDLTVICGPLERHPRDATIVTNPTWVVEVLSPSTESYDRGEKLEKYRQIPTLRGVLFAAQDEKTLELHARSNHWTTHRAGPGEALATEWGELDVDALYAGLA